MSRSAPWKDTERRHAKRMPGGVRLWRPDFGESMPDGESPTDTWDAKTFQRFSVLRLWRECEAKYRAFTAGRRFHLVLHEPGKPGDWVLCRAEDFARLVQIEAATKRWLDELVGEAGLTRRALLTEQGLL